MNWRQLSTTLTQNCQQTTITEHRGEGHPMSKKWDGGRHQLLHNESNTWSRNNIFQLRYSMQININKRQSRSVVSNRVLKQLEIPWNSKSWVTVESWAANNAAKEHQSKCRSMQWNKTDYNTIREMAHWSPDNDWH